MIRATFCYNHVEIVQQLFLVPVCDEASRTRLYRRPSLLSVTAILLGAHLKQRYGANFVLVVRIAGLNIRISAAFASRFASWKDSVETARLVLGPEVHLVVVSGPDSGSCYPHPVMASSPPIES